MVKVYSKHKESQLMEKMYKSGNCEQMPKKVKDNFKRKIIQLPPWKGNFKRKIVQLPPRKGNFKRKIIQLPPGKGNFDSSTNS